MDYAYVVLAGKFYFLLGARQMFGNLGDVSFQAFCDLGKGIVQCRACCGQSGGAAHRVEQCLLNLRLIRQYAG